MVRRKSHPGVTIKPGTNKYIAAVEPILKPMYAALEKFKENLHTYPAFKKYKRLTSTPVGRIARDVVVVFTFVMIMIKWQSSPKYQHIYRSVLGTGDLTYSRYVFNVSVTTNTYRSIIGEVESKTLRHSSEAVVLLGTGQKGADAWNETGVMNKIVQNGYRAIALDPPGQGQATLGYEEPAQGGRVSLRDMGSYMKNVIKLVGVDKIILVVADRGSAQALSLLKEFPEYVKAVCFLTPIVQQDRDPLIIKQYSEWMTKRNHMIISMSPQKDQDSKDSERVLNFFKNVKYEYVKYIGKLWFFEHHDDFEDLFFDWIADL
jgi:hypothetical protein